MTVEIKNINNLKNLLVEKSPNFNEVKSLAKNTGSETKPRYVPQELTGEQKIAIDKLKVITTFEDLVEFCNYDSTLEMHYDMFYIYKHAKLLLKNQHDKNRVKEELVIINRVLNRF